MFSCLSNKKTSRARVLKKNKAALKSHAVFCFTVISAFSIPSLQYIDAAADDDMTHYRMTSVNDTLPPPVSYNTL